MKNTQQFTAIIEKEGNGFVSLCPELDIASQGDSVEEARRNLQEALELFLKNNISINTSGALGDRLFMRLGLQEVTRRGMKEKDMKVLAKLIIAILQRKDVAKDVVKFNHIFSGVEYGFKL